MHTHDNNDREHEQAYEDRLRLLVHHLYHHHLHAGHMNRHTRRGRADQRYEEGFGDFGSYRGSEGNDVEGRARGRDHGHSHGSEHSHGPGGRGGDPSAARRGPKRSRGGRDVSGGREQFSRDIWL